MRAPAQRSVQRSVAIDFAEHVQYGMPRGPIPLTRAPRGPTGPDSAAQDAAAEAARAAQSPADADAELAAAQALAPRGIARYERPKYDAKKQKHDELGKYVGIPISEQEKRQLKSIIHRRTCNFEFKCILAKKIDGMIVRLVFRSPERSTAVYAHAYTRSGIYMCTIPIKCNTREETDKLRGYVESTKFMLWTECTLNPDKYKDITKDRTHKQQTAWWKLLGMLPNGTTKRFEPENTRNIHFHVIWAGLMTDDLMRTVRRNIPAENLILQDKTHFVVIEQKTIFNSNDTFDSRLSQVQTDINNGAEGAVVRFENSNGQWYDDKLYSYKLKHREFGILITPHRNNDDGTLAWVCVMRTVKGPSGNEAKRLFVELQEVKLGIQTKHNWRPAWLEPWDGGHAATTHTRHVVQTRNKEHVAAAIESFTGAEFKLQGYTFKILGATSLDFHAKFKVKLKKPKKIMEIPLEDFLWGYIGNVVLKANLELDVPRHLRQWPPELYVPKHLREWTFNMVTGHGQFPRPRRDKILEDFDITVVVSDDDQTDTEREAARERGTGAHRAQPTNPDTIILSSDDESIHAILSSDDESLHAGSKRQRASPPRGEGRAGGAGGAGGSRARAAGGERAAGARHESTPPPAAKLRLCAVDLEYLGFGDYIKLHPDLTDEEIERDDKGKVIERECDANEIMQYRRLGVSAEKVTPIRTVCIASCVYDDHANRFHTTSYNLEQLLQQGVVAGTDEERYETITKLLEDDHERVVLIESERRKRISEFGSMIDAKSLSCGASALIGFNFVFDKKNINLLRYYDKASEHSWIEYPPIFDLYGILTAWLKKQGKKAKSSTLKYLSEFNGLSRPSTITGVDGLQVFSMFLREDWTKLAEYNMADARETLQLFLRRHIYIELTDMDPTRQKPFIIKVPMDKACGHYIHEQDKKDKKDEKERENIHKILEDAEALRVVIENKEIAQGTLFEPAAKDAARVRMWDLR